MERKSLRSISWDVSEETYVHESFTINEFKGFLKSIYGKDYPEYFI